MPSDRTTTATRAAFSGRKPAASAWWATLLLGALALHVAVAQAAEPSHDEEACRALWPNSTEFTRMLQQLPIPHGSSFKSNADCSYFKATLVDQHSRLLLAGDGDTPSPTLSTEIFRWNGTHIASQIYRFDRRAARITLYDQSGNVAATQALIPTPGALSMQMRSVTFVSAGDWTSATLTFSPVVSPNNASDDQLLDSLSVTRADGSTLTHQPAADGAWSEVFWTAGSALVRTVRHAPSSSPEGKRLGANVEVLDAATGTVTNYPYGDPSVPKLEVPAGVPTDFASARTLWLKLSPSDMKPF